MANEIVHKLKVEADTEEAKSNIKSLGKSVESSMFDAQVAFEVAKKGLSLLSEQISESIGLALDYEKTNIKLKAALRGAGEEVEENAKSLNEQASELQELLGVSDETIRGLQAFAVNTGVSTGKIKDLIKASASVSNSIGIDMKQAMMTLIKTTSGVTEETLKLLPGLRDLSKEELELGGAVDLVNAKLSENSKILTEGYSGQINQLALAWDDLREAIVLSAKGGGIFNGFIKDLTVRLKTLTTLIKDDGLLSIFSPGAFARAAKKVREPVIVKDAPKLDKGSTGGLLRNAPKKKAVGRKTASGKSGGVSFILGDETVNFKEDADFISQSLDSQYSDWLADQDAFERAKLSAKENADNIMDEYLRSKAEYRMSLKEQEMEWEYNKEQEKTAMLKKQQEQRAADTQKMANLIGGMTSELADTVVGGFVLMAEGGEVAFDKLIGDTMKSMGLRLIATGIHDSLVGVSRAIFSYGADASGYALAAQGAAEIAAGAALAGGGAALIGAAGGDQVASTTSPQAVTGRNAAGGGGGGGGGGSQQSTSGGTQQGGQIINAQFFVVGELSEEQVITIRRGMERVDGQGF